MSEYQETVRTIAKKCAEDYVSSILVRLRQENALSAESIDDGIEIDDRLEMMMTQYWSALTDSANEYWRIDNVTAEDKMIVFRKLKKDVEPYLESYVLNLLREEAESLQVECAHDYIHFQEEVDQASVTHANFLSHVLNLQQQLLALTKKASEALKLRMYLAGRGMWLEDESLHRKVKVDSPVADETMSAAARLHRFERKLRGGIVTSVRPHGTFVPESEIRRQGMEHGDLLRVKKSYRHDGQIRYEFELAEKRQEAQPERIQLNYCLVKSEASMYYADSYMNSDGEEQSIRIDEMPHRILIKDEDVKMFKLEAGDLVDIAYWANHPTGAKVIWKHMDGRGGNPDRESHKENAHIA